MEFSAKAFIYLHVNVYGNSFAIRNSWGKIAAQVICQNNILFEKNYIEQFNINISRYKVHFDKKNLKITPWYIYSTAESVPYSGLVKRFYIVGYE